MKKIMLISAFLVAFTTYAQGDSAYKNTALEFVKISNDTEMFNTAIDQLGKEVLDAKKEEFRSEAKKTLDKLYTNMAELFMEEFTHTELKELIVFYKTDLGKKLAVKQTTISQKAMKLGVLWGSEVQMISKKYSAQ